MAAEFDKNKNELKLFFNPSTIENIDQAIFNYVESLNLSTKTNEGYRKVPVIWGSSERGFQSKREQELRNTSGLLKYPIITVKRMKIDKSYSKRAAFHGNMPEVNDEQGGSYPSHRILHQEKTNNFANADSLRRTGRLNSPAYNSKVVYRTISAPMPVNVAVSYDIMIRTEYQEQMNDLLVPFLTTTGTVNFVSITNQDHRYEAFISQNINQTSNIDNYGNEDRRFDATIPIEVIGYLIGEGPNREKPYYSVRENAVEVRIPRERISLAEIPEHEYGNYYGLSGLPADFSLASSPMSVLLSNIPAVGAGFLGQPQAPSGGGGGGGGTTIIVNERNTEVVREIIGDIFLFREMLKDRNVPVPDGNIWGPNNFTFLETNQPIRGNSETVFRNGLVQAFGENQDYTIIGKKIRFNTVLLEGDSVYITYIVDT